MLCDEVRVEINLDDRTFRRDQKLRRCVVSRESGPLAAIVDSLGRDGVIASRVRVPPLHADERAGRGDAHHDHAALAGHRARGRGPPRRPIARGDVPELPQPRSLAATERHEPRNRLKH